MRPWRRIGGRMGLALGSLRLLCLGLCLSSGIWGASDSAAAAERRPPLMFVTIDGRELEVKPLHWSEQFVSLMARDGGLWNIRPQQVSSFRTTTQSFETYSPTAMRAQLTREFGDGFQVTAAGKFLVVHPRGRGEKWAARFDELYRSFRHYFMVRGFALSEPEFPLVAIVLRSEAEFRRYRHQEQVPEGVLGYYSPRTNRVVLYDVTAGQSEKAWAENAGTIIHEATHQTAFNTGIHNRLNSPPRWVAEGLGTMFEARGVWNSRQYTRPSDRINRERLESFRQYLPRRREDALMQLVASDRVFQDDMIGAYAEAWAWTFFLVETRPREFARYLQLTTGKDFQPASDSQRLSDFTQVFGTNLKLLDAQFVRFMRDLK